MTFIKDDRVSRALREANATLDEVVSRYSDLSNEILWTLHRLGQGGAGRDEGIIDEVPTEQ